MSRTDPHDWLSGVLGDAIVAAEGGVSVNSENRPADIAECGVLKTSSLVDGRFAADENKAILPSDRERARIQPRKDHILFSRMNTPALVGQSGFVDKDYKNLFLPDRIWQLTIRKTFDPRWFGYCLRSDHVVRQIIDAATGTSNSMKNISKPSLMAIPVSLPPLPEQQKIAAILSSVDDVIEKTRAQIDKLKDLKTGMMQELLTRGVGSGGAPHTEFEDTPVGTLPSEWNVELLDKVAARGSGHTPSKSKSEYWNAGVDWVSLSDTNKLDRLYINTTAKQISELGIQNSSAVIHPPGTVVLSRDAGIGKSGIITKKMAVSQHFIAWQCSDRLHNHFLYYVLQFWKPKFEAIAMGSTIKTIGLPFFKKLHVPVPPISEQKTIAGTLQSIDLKIFSIERKLNATMAVKKALMQDLLTGKVRVNVEKEALSHVE